MAMTLKNVLEDVRMVGSDGLQKTASESNKPEKTATAQQELVAALNKAVKGTEKTATAEPAQGSSAVDSLVKMATDLAGTEQQALAKEAHLYGAAVADGFVSRLNQYDQSLDATGVKTATASGEFVPSEEEFVKFANENPQLVQQTMEQGYADTLSQIDQVKTSSVADVEMQKLASTPEGQAEIQAIEKLASTEEGQTKLAGIEQGFVDGVRDIVKLAETEDGMQKLADIQAGYSDTLNEVEKVANDCFSRGFQDVINLVERNVQSR